MRRTGLALVIILSSPPALPAVAADIHDRTCFSPSETREKIASGGLSEPLRLMRGAASRLGADAISARLCQRDRDFVYDISLLKRDGHVVHVMLNARDGQAYPAPPAREEHRGE